MPVKKAKTKMHGRQLKLDILLIKRKRSSTTPQLSTKTQQKEPTKGWRPGPITHNTTMGIVCISH